MSIVLAPFIARIYSPSVIGELSFFLAVSGFLILLSTFQFENAIITEKEESVAWGITIFCLLSACIVATILLILLCFFSLPLYWWFLPFLVLFSSFAHTLSHWNNRLKKFNKTAYYTISQSFCTNLLKITFPLFYKGSLGLFFASVLGQLFSLCFFISSLQQKYSFSFQSLKEKLAVHRDFPRYSLPHKLIQTFAFNLPILFFSFAFSDTEVGLFAMAITLSIKPLSALARGVNQVLFQQVGERHRQNSGSSKLLRSYILKILTIAVPFLLLIYVALPHLILFFFGEKWISLANILQLMLPWMLAMFLSNSLNFIPSVHLLQKKAFVLELFGIFVQLIMLILGVYLDSFILSISLLSFSTTIFLIIQITFFYRATN
ncbi:MAG: oligosaccharide flippase family protein [Paludibacteraceae bacterium]|nr:oligosaccharide flippase family protein [Paludibacteraceae bacterium]